MSWVIVNKHTNEVIFETWQKSITQKLNKDKYKAIQIKEWLSSLNQKTNI
ncbi:hypothetical protein Phi13:2_gp053 [Cellulophaga phage phi13:2]|uniref:Uncharacterized protein n=1 Tax=Cellulophaga phage phi13:2 TaxID=1328030 RepID=S0A5S0_9CAUD|nr:hypothetical protein Phi13:2_gp053 [Cellulophaga phage phi13:2]AGO49663.1 hypothetical protein Phi13:2_gp053 [Cellulophaga phage phi13:2]